ncbi:hypothetical protein ACET3Z_015431 [Daucus carota]
MAENPSSQHWNSDNRRPQYRRLQAMQVSEPTISTHQVNIYENQPAFERVPGRRSLTQPGPQLPERGRSERSQQEPRYENQQGIEYIQQSTRSRTSRRPHVQRLEYEDQQGIEYIQPSARSERSGVRRLVREDQQGIEYIQPSTRSERSGVQRRKDEDQQGIEDVQQCRRSTRATRHVPESHDQQGIEYIQGSTRSERPEVLKRQGRYGIEYIQNRRSSNPYASST